MPSTRSNLALSFQAPRQPRKGMAHDYRLMVEAVQAGDLTGARNAYGHMMERLSGVGVGADDTLARIGVSLRHGDLGAAQRTLDRLESRALRVLKGLREHVDPALPDLVPYPVKMRKPN